MKLAIFPGTFNPIHIGHLMIAESACIQFGLEKIKLVVSPFPPNKLNSKDFLPINKRVALIEEAIKDNPRFEIDLREINRKGPSYTVETIHELIQEFNLRAKEPSQPPLSGRSKKEFDLYCHPEKGDLGGFLKEKIHFIMGVDSFLSLPSWHKAHELKEYCKFLIASRPGWQKIDVKDSLSSFHDEIEWEIIDSPPLAISSTQIRSRKRENKSYRYLLPERVYEIYKNLDIENRY
ncbi:MAG: nicotinate (nicotinamide) nucleotide adenylyltransferase [Candidatus Caenarcaniphilales bacterium]|nr:nicotinate (nicotinamide) nucleotide adenylyltransferase [Candidatus Caenarcaniphilales bacterium]